MIRRFVGLMITILMVMGCKDEPSTSPGNDTYDPNPVLNLMQANRLAFLPIGCVQVEYPNKLGQTLNDATHLKAPQELHPAFFGCFDWHSAVHGHWSLVVLLKQFPNLDQAGEIRSLLGQNLTKENIQGEIEYFKMKGNASFERTYGWAWLLKLAEELQHWDDPLGNNLASNLQPLTELIIEGYLDFLPKLNYPIRVGEHSNTAFGLSLAWDYAEQTGHKALKEAIVTSVERFYVKDRSCPISWEPSGFDFLSPCLEEAYLLSKVLPQQEFREWFNNFLPSMTEPSFSLEPAGVTDRTDGKLVHLDGLNFSRAWCLYGIASSLPENGHLKGIANRHIQYSLPNIVDGNYEGTHWLGTFALHALNNVE